MAHFESKVCHWDTSSKHTFSKSKNHVFKVYFGVTPSRLREIKIKNFTLTISNIPFEKAQIKKCPMGTAKV
jgi:hypothetical protein